MNGSLAEAVLYVGESGKEYQSFSMGESISPYRPLVPPREIKFAKDAKKGATLPPFAANKAIFALNGAEIDKWKNHEYFPDMWDVFLRSASGKNKGGVIGLHFDVFPQDEAYVLDWAPVEWDLTNYGSVLPNTWLKYLHSRVPIADYKGNFELPEIVIPKPISRERVRLEERVIK